MKLYSYQGKQWVIQGEFAAELGIDRHALERETRQRPFSARHVIVLRDRSRHAFLKANGISRSGGPIALIDKEGAEQVEARLKAKPVQATLQGAAQSLSRVTSSEAAKEALGRAYVIFEGRRVIQADILGKLLGYAPSGLPGIITREWAYLLQTPADFERLSGDRLRVVKKAWGLPRRTSRLLVVSESGVAKILSATNKFRDRPTPVVYFVQCLHRRDIKIGVAVDVQRRLQNLVTQSGRTLVLLATTGGGRDRERSLHRKFATSRIVGEWFRETPELLEEIARIGVRESHAKRDHDRRQTLDRPERPSRRASRPRVQDRSVRARA